MSTATKASDLDTGWSALMAIFSKPTRDFDKDRCDITATLNYQEYLNRMSDIRNAWLYKDNSIEYYQRRSYQILTLVARKEAGLLTQMVFDPQIQKSAQSGVKSCRFRLFSSDQDKYGNEKPYVIVSWSFNSDIASKIHWEKLDDKRFPELAIDYKFGQEFERRMKQDPPP